MEPGTPDAPVRPQSPLMPFLHGTGAMALVLALIEILRLSGAEIPNPSAVYFVALVYACLVGRRSGSIGALAMGLLYAFLTYADPPGSWTYDAEAGRRLLVVCIAAPLIVVMIHLWKRKYVVTSTRRQVAAFDEIAKYRQMEENMGRLAAIVESSEDAIYSKDLAGRVQTWNPAAERLYGYPADEIMGRELDLIVPHELRGEIPQILQKIITGQRVEHFETERIRKDGTRIKVQISVSPIYNLGGNVVGASTIARRVQ